jgi:hypothetical protein
MNGSVWLWFTFGFGAGVVVLATIYHFMDRRWLR